ncbi:MAG TPA: hypothetical protein VE172_00475 [Stackebrandtia sp.]|uniref:hypothetical protein n=1 Tax=Stackebrandtia sp. TaxID=2023065 RepID=UPI002D3390AB|nr:hypothetical protein [Stackebrandtia sp.]HZE37263.1 hypothetical protein [Stackebrandtia sp.]
MLKADLHMHQEWSPRLDRVLARRHGRRPFDWKTWRRALIAEVPPGLARLQRLSRVFPAPAEADTDEAFVERVADALDESAAAGSCYTEMRFGSDTILRPGFMALFRRAEQRVHARHPGFRAEALAGLLLWHEPDRLDRVLEECRRAASDGLAGVDLLNVPYNTEADWHAGRTVISAAAEAGLGVTVHAGEFSVANIAAVAGMEGVTRVGHATHATDEPWLLDLLAARDITVEVCVTANLVLGAVGGLVDHPLRRMVDAGVKVALGTDNPVQFGTDIAHEYELAERLGLSDKEIAEFTRCGFAAAFTSPQRRAELLRRFDAAPAMV